MKALIGLTLILSAWAGSAMAATHNSQVLRAGIDRVKANVDTVIANLDERSSLNEADADLLHYLTTSSKRLEQGQDALDLADTAPDSDTYLNFWSQACGRVAAARAQLGNAARRARDINSPYPTATYVDEQRTDITDTRDAVQCPH